MATITAHRERIPQRAETSGFPWPFFALAFAFTWLVCLPGVLATWGRFSFPVPDLALAALAQFGPSLAALVLVAHQDGGDGVKRLLKRALHFRIPLPWLLATLVVPLVLTGSALALNVATGGKPPALDLLAQPVAIVPTFLLIFLLQGPVPEEFGWRGYALDRLQARWNALSASLVLGAIWAVWHLPTFFMDGVSQTFLPLWPYLLSVVAFSVLMTWLYNNTGRDLLVALLFHTMINLSIALFPPLELVRGGDQRGFFFFTGVYVIAAALMVLVWGPQKLSRRQDM